MSVAALAIGEPPVSDQTRASMTRKTPSARVSTAKADATLTPEPR